jgi:membrane fusion protein, multidrug efflux system
MQMRTTPKTNAKTMAPVWGAVLLLLLSGCNPRSTTAPIPPSVEVTPVTRGNVPIYQEWIGTLDGAVNAQIRAQVSGYLVAQDYQDGERVKKGELLFEIDPRSFQATLDQAQGVLSQAEARSAKTELDVNRYAPLVKNRAISQEEYDDAVQANIETKAAVISAKALVEQARLNLEFTKIASPIDGMPDIPKAQLGDLVGPASGELTTVSRTDPIKAYFSVSEQSYVNFTRLFATDRDRSVQLRSLEAELILPDGSLYSKKGSILAIDRSVGETTGAIRVEAEFPNPNGSLRPGMFARVRVKTDYKRDAVLVPIRAISEMQGTYQIAWVDSENRAHVQPVHVGERMGDLCVVADGLDSGRDVIVEGLQFVRDGMLVTPTAYVKQ